MMIFGEVPGEVKTLEMLNQKTEEEGRNFDSFFEDLSNIDLGENDSLYIESYGLLVNYILFEKDND